MRPGQNNNYKNRNRNRNRHRGGGGGGGGGNSNNRVLDSNGPDVKLRGTPQTIAEKYIQLARDAASAGDRVMAESYYQHADHYYRLWLAAQPPGQPIQFGRRPDEEVDDADNAEGDEDGNGDNGNAEGAEAGEGQPGAEAAGEGDAPSGDEGQQNRNFRNRDNRENRDQNKRDQGGGGRDRFRNRWPRRGDRYNENRDGNAPSAEGQEPRQDGAESPVERPERSERSERPERQDRPPRRERAEASPVAEDKGDWEAPSFLKRPMPAVGDDAEGDVAATERKPRARRPRYGEEGVTANEPPANEE